MVEGAHEKYCWKIESEDSESGESGLFGVPIRDEERVVHVPAFAADISRSPGNLCQESDLLINLNFQVHSFSGSQKYLSSTPMSLVILFRSHYNTWWF